MISLASLAVDAVHSQLGTSATFTPSGGSAVDVKVIDRQPDPVLGGFNSTQHRQPGRVLEIRRAALAADPADGDTVLIGTTTYRVRSAKPADPDGLTFELECVPDR